MFNKKYKKGMADAAKAYEAFGKKQEDALKHILEEVRQGNRDLESVLRELNGNMDSLYDYIDSKEKAHLYSVYTPFDIIKLDKNDRLFLVGVLYRLTADKAPNENQQNYIRAVQRYLEIKEPPFGIDPMYIETIEDIPTQKAILQTVLEYLYLQDGDSYDETEYQQEFLDAFSVNTKGRKEIMDRIDLLYTATGAKGLAEKYGYVPEDTAEYSSEIDSENENTYTGFHEISDELLGQIFSKDVSIKKCIETDSFVFTIPNTTFLSVLAVFGGLDKTKYEFNLFDKRTNAKVELAEFPPTTLHSAQFLENDTIVVELGRQEKSIELFDLSCQEHRAIVNGDTSLQLLRVTRNYVVYTKSAYCPAYTVWIYVYDVITGRTREVPMPPDKCTYYKKAADICGGSLYLLDSEQFIYQMDLNNNFTIQKKYKVSIPGHPCKEIRGLRVSDKQVFCWSNEGIYKDYLARLDLEHGKTHILATIGENGLVDEGNLYDDYFIYRDSVEGSLYGIRLDTVETVKLAGSQVGSQFPNIRNFIYFKRNDEYWYRVDINSPMQVDVVP